jgi:hypothetical protein
MLKGNRTVRAILVAAPLFTLRLVTTGRGSQTDHSLNNALLEMIKIPQMIKYFPTLLKRADN